MTTRGNDADDKDDESEVDDSAPESDSVADFLAQFPNGEQFIIVRLEPRKMTFRGQEKNISGHLRTVFHAPTLDEIAETWGGGLFEVRVMGPMKGHKGHRILCIKKFEIAGDPKYVESRSPSVATEGQPQQPVDSSSAVIERVWEQTLEEKRRLEDKYDRERHRLDTRPPIHDPVVQVIQQNHRDQVDTLRLQVERRDKELSEVRQQLEAARAKPSPLENPDVLKALFRDTELSDLRQQVEAARAKPSPLENPDVLKVLFGRGENESARLVDQHKTELQLERDRHQREIEGERERHRRDLEQHERSLLAERERHQRDLERQQRDLEIERERQQRDVEVERERQQRDTEQHRRELTGETERRQREIEGVSRDQKQHVDVIERLHRSEIETLRAGHVQLVATKDEHIARLSEELQRLRTAANPPDALSDLARVGKVVSAVREFVPGLGGETPATLETSGWEKVLEHARPLIEKFADNLAPPRIVTLTAPPPPVVTQPRAASATLRRRQPIEQQIVRMPTALRDPRREPAAQSRPAAPPWQPPVPTAQGAAVPRTTHPTPNVPPMGPTMAPPPTPDVWASPPTSPAASASATPTMIEGLGFVESAFDADRPVDEVSRQAASRFPASTLRSLVSAGPDLILGEVERRSPDSPLASPGGKRYLRDLVEALRAHLDAKR